MTEKDLEKIDTPLEIVESSPQEALVNPLPADVPLPVASEPAPEEYLSSTYKTDLAGLRSTRIRYWYSMGLVTIPIATIVLMIFLSFVVGAHLIPKFCNY